MVEARIPVSEGVSEFASLFRPDFPNGSAVLFTHGYTSNSFGYNEFAEACANIGCTSLAFDLLSHGQSDGNRQDLTVSDYLDGFAAAHQYVSGQPNVDPQRIGIMAGSFGAYLAVLLAEHHPVKSLLLRVPALYPDSLRDVPRRQFDTDAVLEMQPETDNTALDIIRGFVGRVLLVSSGHDQVISEATVEAYDQALNASGEHIEMTEAAHILDPVNRRLFKRTLLDWAAEL